MLIVFISPYMYKDQPTDFIGIAHHEPMLKQ